MKKTYLDEYAQKVHSTSNELLGRWIQNGPDKIMVHFADEFAQNLTLSIVMEGEKDKMDNKKLVALTASQMRRFFSAVKSLQQQGYEEGEFVMLLPKLAYAVGRARQQNRGKSLKIEDFQIVISAAINEVNKCEKQNRDAAFRNFISFFEAIVAYHKVYDRNN